MWKDALQAIRSGLCPRCRRGRVFRGRIQMNETCPHCSLKFEREQGYFVGAMYISYAIGSVLIAALCLLVWIAAPGLSFEMRLLAAALLAVPFSPAILRSSRLLWMYFDRGFESYLDGDPPR
ncbi:MAG TPA: DUF983 domain-containing protein [Terriglobales bacterium]|nr:DUF983 domain-containing protein [Terriglobales bacterium]